MKADELKTKTADELKKLLIDLRREQMNQRFQKTAGQLANTSLVSKTRKNIARVKTFLSAAIAGKTESTKTKTAAKKPAAKKSA